MVRRIEIMGEAVAHLNESTRNLFPMLPFRKIRGMRNILAHDYAHVDPDTIWTVAVDHVPELRLILETFFARSPG